MSSKPSPTPCTSCGAEAYETNWNNYEGELDRMESEGVCFTCCFWLNVIDEPQHVVVNGGAFYPKPAKTNPPNGGRWLGHSGRWFRIVRADGTVVQSNDVWYRGKVPVLFRDRLPDNATFEDPAPTGEGGEQDG